MTAAGTKVESRPDRSRKYRLDALSHAVHDSAVQSEDRVLRTSRCILHLLMYGSATEIEGRG